MPMAVQADAIPERRLPGWYTIPAGGWMSHTRKILASQVLVVLETEREHRALASNAVPWEQIGGHHLLEVAGQKVDEFLLHRRLRCSRDSPRLRLGLSTIALCLGDLKPQP